MEAGGVLAAGRGEVHKVPAGPAAVRGHLTVTARDDSPESSIHEYVWHAEAERENPGFFLFSVTPPQRGDGPMRVLNRMANGWDLKGETSAEAEILWQDEAGNEVSRQRIRLIETEEAGEGSEG